MLSPPSHSFDGKASIQIPAGTQPGTVFRLRGKGMPVLGARASGDLHVRVNVSVPTKLNAEQKRLLREYAEASGGSGFRKFGRRKR